jgi:hypothetical protein
MYARRGEKEEAKLFFAMLFIASESLFYILLNISALLLLCWVPIKPAEQQCVRTYVSTQEITFYFRNPFSLNLSNVAKRGSELRRKLRLNVHKIALQ